MNTEKNDKEFLSHASEILDSLKELAEMYGVEDKLAMMCSVSLVNPSEYIKDEVMYSTLTNLMVNSEEELDSMCDHLKEVYKNMNGYSYDDLFKDINLN